MVREIEKNKLSEKIRKPCTVNNINVNTKIHMCQHSEKCDICRVTKQNLKISDVEFFLSAHEKIKESGLYNFQGCRITVNHKLNMSYLTQQAPDVCLTSDIGYILVATSYNQFPTSIRRHFLTSFGRLDWTLF